MVSSYKKSLHTLSLGGKLGCFWWKSLSEIVVDTNLKNGICEVILLQALSAGLSFHLGSSYLVLSPSALRMGWALAISSGTMVCAMPG